MLAIVIVPWLRTLPEIPRLPAVPPAGAEIVPVLVSVSVAATVPSSVCSREPPPVRLIVPALIESALALRTVPAAMTTDAPALIS